MTFIFHPVFCCWILILEGNAFFLLKGLGFDMRFTNR